MYIKIYSRIKCQYCIKLKDWFKNRDITFDEILVETAEAVEEFVKECPGATTVPQIFVDGVLIPGGHDGFMESDVKKQLENQYMLIS